MSNPGAHFAYRSYPCAGYVAEPRSPLYLALGRTLMHARELRGYSEAELAVRAGLRDQDVCMIEAGEQVLPLSTIERLADALELPTSTLIRYAERERR